MTRGRIAGPAGIVMALLTAPASAETLVVRSGEHDGFSRIVLAPAQKTAWKLGRVGAGYELRLLRSGITFDLSRAFDLIPRQRLSALSEGTVDGSIAFGLACDCRAIGFETASGAIVVDIVNGPARPDSGFEAELDAGPGERTAALSPEPGLRLPFALDVNQNRAAASDPLPFWADRLPTRDGSGSAGPDDTSPRIAPEIPPDPVNAAATRPTAEAAADPGTDGLPLTSQAASPAKPERATDPVPSVPSPTDGRDLRISNTERDLLFQLGRAASQGLVTPVGPAPPRSAPPRSAPPPPAAETPQATQLEEGVPPRSESNAPGQGPDGGVAMRSETSIDRAALGIRADEATLTPDGSACAPDDAVAVASWGEAENPVAQLAAARATMVGEFDAPDPAAIVATARLYVRLGFGAEALATLDAFDIPDDRAPLLRDLAHLVDGTTPGLKSGLALQTACESDVALWALLARGQVTPGDQTARGAALRAFAALPPHLRRALGPRLADIFLTAGEADAARSVRDAADRAAVAPERTIELIDARIDLSAGDTAAAEPLLDRLASGNDPTAREALILGIETRLRAGDPVDALPAEAAAALAKEFGGTALGGRLQRAAALALAANGAFGRAFDSLAAAPDLTEADRRTAELAIFDRIVRYPDDAVFLAQMAAQMPRFRASRPDQDLQLQIAERLAAAGLPALVGTALDDAAAATEAGRILMARALLSGFEPEKALQVLDGLASADAVPLRARADSMIGNDQAAAEAFAAAGLTREGAEAALRAGDWARAAALGDDAMRENLRSLGLIGVPRQPGAGQPGAGQPDGGQPGVAQPGVNPPGAAPGTAGNPGPAPVSDAVPPAGPIAAARGLVDASSRTRASIDRLLLSLQ